MLKVYGLRFSDLLIG